MTECNNKKNTGIPRVIAAFFYSIAGLRATFRQEAAFRQELVLYLLLLPLLFLLPLPIWLKCILFMANTAVLIVELLNSAIEAVVDMVSPDYHLLAKQAKDMGSAAVFLTLIMTGLFWAYAFILLATSN